jgi:hypothetical protein
MMTTPLPPPDREGEGLAKRKQARAAKGSGHQLTAVLLAC